MALEKNKVIFEKDEVMQEIRSLIRTLEKAHIIVNAAYLFGSYGKGTAHEWSDIDVAIVSDDFCGVSFDDYKRLIPLIMDYNSFIEIHTFRPENFDSDEDLFVKEITETGIKIR